jgi:hypothetical protein
MGFSAALILDRFSKTVNSYGYNYSYSDIKHGQYIVCNVIVNDQKFLCYVSDGELTLVSGFDSLITKKLSHSFIVSKRHREKYKSRIIRELDSACLNSSNCKKTYDEWLISGTGFSSAQKRLLEIQACVKFSTSDKFDSGSIRIYVSHKPRMNIKPYVVKELIKVFSERIDDGSVNIVYNSYSLNFNALFTIRQAIDFVERMENFFGVVNTIES